MPYRNYTPLGLDLIEEWGASAPFRMNRLITALEDFAVGGPATRIDQGGAGETEVYLVPPLDPAQRLGRRRACPC